MGDAAGAPAGFAAIQAMVRMKRSIEDSTAFKSIEYNTFDDDDELE